MKISSVLISAAFLCATAVGVGAASQIYVDNSSVQQAEAADETSSSFTFTFDLSQSGMLSDSTWDESVKICMSLGGSSAPNGWTNTTSWGDCYVEFYPSISNPSLNVEIPYDYSEKALYVKQDLNGGGDKINGISLSQIAKLNNGQKKVLRVYNNSWNYRWDIDRNFQGVTQDNIRIWVKRTSGYANTNYVSALHFWQDATDELVIPTGYVDYCTSDASGNNTLLYYDVPKSLMIGSNYQIMYFNSNFVDDPVGGTQATTEGYASGDNAQIYYAYDGSGWNLGYGMGQNDNGSTFQPSIMSTVMEAYFTCSSDLDNGYGSINNVVSTWSNDVADFESKMAEVTLNDYESMDTNYSGEKTYQTNVAAKIAKMEEVFNNNSSSSSAFDFASNPSLYGAVIASSAVLLGGVSVIAIRRKRRARA